MARAPATLDPFNAIAEPKRRRVLDLLAGWGNERPVNALVESLGWPQAQVSKHLAVLREVGLVSARRRGRERMYRVNGQQIKTIHDWAGIFERFWTHQLDRIKRRAEGRAGSAAHPGPHPHHTDDHKESRP